MKPLLVFLAGLGVCLLSGCAVPVIGPLTLSHLSTIASAATMTVQGKGAAEVALDAATGKDCRMIEGVMRNDRQICEENGSAATDADFKGVIAFLADRPKPARPDQDILLARANAGQASQAMPGHTIRALKRNRPESEGLEDSTPLTLEADYARKSTAKLAKPPSPALAQLPVLAQITR